MTWKQLKSWKSKAWLLLPCSRGLHWLNKLEQSNIWSAQHWIRRVFGRCLLKLCEQFCILWQKGTQENVSYCSYPWMMGVWSWILTRILEGSLMSWIEDLHLALTALRNGLCNECFCSLTASGKLKSNSWVFFSNWEVKRRLYFSSSSLQLLQRSFGLCSYLVEEDKRRDFLEARFFTR